MYRYAKHWVTYIVVVDKAAVVDLHSFIRGQPKHIGQTPSVHSCFGGKDGGNAVLEERDVHKVQRIKLSDLHSFITVSIVAFTFRHPSWVSARA